MKKTTKKTEEVTVEKEVENDYVPPVEETPAPITYEADSLKAIEDERLNFFRTFKLQNTLKWVIALICIAAIVVAFIVIPNSITGNDNLKSGLMIGIAVGALVATLGYSIFTKRSMNKKMKLYFNHFYSNVAKYAFDQEGFANAVVQEPGKINIDQFNDCRLYKDIAEVGSRGLTEFEYNSIPMAIVDCAGNVRADKRIKPVFVGKYLFSATSYVDEQIIAIYFKGNDRSLPPTNLTEIATVEDNEKFVIYSNNKNWKKVITPAIIKQLNTLKMGDLLVDLAISMHDGKMFVAFGYDDPIMVLPLQNQFNPKPIMQYKNDLMDVVKIVEALNK